MYLCFGSYTWCVGRRGETRCDRGCVCAWCFAAGVVIYDELIRLDQAEKGKFGELSVVLVAPVLIKYMRDMPNASDQDKKGVVLGFMTAYWEANRGVAPVQQAAQGYQQMLATQQAQAYQGQGAGMFGAAAAVPGQFGAPVVAGAPFGGVAAVPGVFGAPVGAGGPFGAAVAAMPGVFGAPAMLGPFAQAGVAPGGFVQPAVAQAAYGAPAMGQFAQPVQAQVQQPVGWAGYGMPQMAPGVWNGAQYVFGQAFPPPPPGQGTGHGVSKGCWTCGRAGHWSGKCKETLDMFQKPLVPGKQMFKWPGAGEGGSH